MQEIEMRVMAKNSGKIFEESIKNSIPDYCLLIRLPDPPHSFTKRSDTRFSVKNPCDYILFDSISRTLMPLELKSTKYKSISYEDVNSEEEQNKMIHKHQILGLLEMSKYNGVSPSFVFNFRDEKNDMERTYLQDINSFVKMTNEISKSSCNEIDLLMYNAKRIEGRKKRTRYVWDIDGLLKEINGNKNQFKCEEE